MGLPRRPKLAQSDSSSPRPQRAPGGDPLKILFRLRERDGAHRCVRRGGARLEPMGVSLTSCARAGGEVLSSTRARPRPSLVIPKNDDEREHRALRRRGARAPRSATGAGAPSRPSPRRTRATTRERELRKVRAEPEPHLLAHDAARTRATRHPRDPPPGHRHPRAGGQRRCARTIATASTAIATGRGSTPRRRRHAGAHCRVPSAPRAESSGRRARGWRRMTWWCPWRGAPSLPSARSR